MGRAVSLKPSSPEIDDTMNRKGADADFAQAESSNKVKLERRKSDSKSKPGPTDGKAKSASYRADTKPRAENNANDQKNAGTTNRKRQNDEQNRASTKQNTMKVGKCLLF